MGGLRIFDVLPETVDFFDLGTNIKFVYLFVVAVGIFTFHKFYWKGGGAPKADDFQRSVAPRTMPSDPSVRRDFQQQRGYVPPPRYNVPQQQQPPPQQQYQQQQPGQEDLWGRFENR